MGELLVAGLLLCGRTRRVGIWLAIVMHSLLLLAVGPLGLNHEAGVVVWNVFFVGQHAMFLGVGRRGAEVEDRYPTEAQGGMTALQPDRSTEGGKAGGTRDQRISWAGATVLVAILWPGLRSVGMCDNWPAWAVYAPGIEQVRVLIRDDQIERLPESLWQWVEPRRIADGWSWLRVDRWCIEAVNAPIYPQDRFAVGVVLAISNRYLEPGGLRVIHESSAGRWDGKRDVRELKDLPAIRRLASEFRLNAQPRKE